MTQGLNSTGQANSHAPTSGFESCPGHEFRRLEVAGIHAGNVARAIPC